MTLARPSGLRQRSQPLLRRGLRIAILIGLVAAAGCVSLPPPAPWDLSEPGWTLRQGQAVWRPGRDAVEIAGDLLVATHRDGRSLVQFTKPPLPLVSAQRTPNAWHAQFFAQKKSYSAPGRPPRRLLWLQLPDALLGGQPRSPWSFTPAPEGRWRLENVGAGEALEGFLKTTRLPPSHSVRPGETLQRVAQSYGIVPESILDANPGPPAEWFLPGRTIRLPLAPANGEPPTTGREAKP